MKKVKNGLFVQVDYTGSLNDGDVFDTSNGREPLEVQMGAGQLIQGFENALIDMTVDEEKRFTLTPDEAYGQRDEKLVRDFPRKDVPPGLDPKVGLTVAMTTADGRQIPASITEVDDQNITIDMNHPLAGKSLTFDIKVVGITNEATQSPKGCGTGCDCSSGCC